MINRDRDNILKINIMKKIFFSSIAFVCFFLLKANAQNSTYISNGPSVLVDNEKIRITEYISLPGKDVCGNGMHTHTDHGNILLTDAHVKVKKEDGSSENQIFDSLSQKLIIEKNGIKQTIPTKGVFWVSGETHSVVNIGKKPMRFYIVEVKK